MPGHRSKNPYLKATAKLMDLITLFMDLISAANALSEVISISDKATVFPEPTFFRMSWACDTTVSARLSFSSICSRVAASASPSFRPFLALLHPVQHRLQACQGLASQSGGNLGVFCCLGTGLLCCFCSFLFFRAASCFSVKPFPPTTSTSSSLYRSTRSTRSWSTGTSSAGSSGSLPLFLLLDLALALGIRLRLAALSTNWRASSTF